MPRSSQCGRVKHPRTWRRSSAPRRSKTPSSCSTKPPLADDVNFRALAERFAVSGGDIKNAVLKAATAAATEPGPDVGKRIHQRHFERAMEDVVGNRSVMRQSVLDDDALQRTDPAVQAVQSMEER